MHDLPTRSCRFRALPHSPHTWGSLRRPLTHWSTVDTTGWVAKKYLSSPHAWGSVLQIVPMLRDHVVFPTGVGVCLRPPRASSYRCRLPHIRGGLSFVSYVLVTTTVPSPHAWGSVHVFRLFSGLEEVFPICVGVCPRKRLRHGHVFSVTRGGFSQVWDTDHVHTRLPYTRGGLSVRGGVALGRTISSPRAWGSVPQGAVVRRHAAVFPTQVGIFPAPRDCRGSSRRLPTHAGVCRSLTGHSSPSPHSPHAWGSVRRPRPSPHRCWVFPARVGVCPGRLRPLVYEPGLPHVRGGLSRVLILPKVRSTSSPYPWGSAIVQGEADGGVHGFSPRVGVRPAVRHRSRPICRLPHTCGVVPPRTPSASSSR